MGKIAYAEAWSCDAARSTRQRHRKAGGAGVRRQHLRLQSESGLSSSPALWELLWFPSL